VNANQGLTTRSITNFKGLFGGIGPRSRAP
jgi:hypothetical protein